MFRPINSSGVLVDGTPVASVADLRKAVLSRSDAFITTTTERLMTYALARGVESYDMPAVRAVRNLAAKDDYRMQTIILGIVQSVPFSMRRTPET